MVQLSGIFPPIPTAFDQEGNLAPEKLQSNLTRLGEFGLTGFLILGSNGEMVMLSESERREVLIAAREAIPSNKLMLAGTGMQSTRETIAATRVAAEAGAAAALVLNPSYFKGEMTPEALVRHYHTVAAAASIPIIIYNMPACSGLDMDAATIIKISEHANIIGIKDSGGNIGKMSSVIRAASDDFQFLVGSANVFLPALTVGAVGGILALANIAPSQCLAIRDFYSQGDLDQALLMQQKMIPVNEAVTTHGGVPALKAAMDHLGLYGGPARPPLLPLSDQRRESLRTFLDDNGITL